MEVEIQIVGKLIGFIISMIALFITLNIIFDIIENLFFKLFKRLFDWSTVREAKRKGISVAELLKSYGIEDDGN